jgi:RNAse (barnase) inhibitor barstar
MAIAETRAPLYRLVHADLGGVLLAAEELQGFFVSDLEAKSSQLQFVGVTHDFSAVPWGQSEDVELQVMNWRGEVIGSYYIGRVFLNTPNDGAINGGCVNVTASFYGFSCPYPRASEVWRRWASLDQIRLGEWRTYPKSWLHVVQTAWFESGHSAKRYGTDSEVAIDGNEITSEDGFFCALGEAVNGAGGYFGSTLSGLADCLALSGASSHPFRIRWVHESASVQNLGREFVESVIAVFEDYGVEVTPE